MRRMFGAAVLALLLCQASVAAAFENLPGVWRGVMVTPWGQGMAVEVIFFPNGTYSSAADMGGLMGRHWGRYEVLQNWIHFRLEGAEPRERCGPTRCTRLHWPATETWVVTRYDGTVIETANGRLMRVR